MGSNGLLYVAAAYGVIWVVLFVYLVTLHQKVTAVRARLESARRRSELDAEGRVGDGIAGIGSQGNYRA